MKKEKIFAPRMLVIGVLLFMLRATGMAAHIAISVVGIFVLAAYTAATKKTWKKPALEILMRACYGIALISGVVVMNVSKLAVVGLVHRVSAALFVVLFVVLYVMKLTKK